MVKVHAATASRLIDCGVSNPVEIVINQKSTRVLKTTRNPVDASQ